jgi:hypothetical protein
MGGSEKGLCDMHVGFNSIFRQIPSPVLRKVFPVMFPSRWNGLQELRDKEGPYSLKMFDDHRCIFVHIPKCAGISINQALFGHLGAGHRTIGWYQLIFEPGKFNSYFKFSVVRNPFDRLVSAYTFLQGGGLTEKDRRWALEHLSGYNDFDSFVKGWLTRKNIYIGLHFIPQYRFVCTRNKKVMVDYIANVETLDQDFNKIANRLGVGGELPMQNTSARSHAYQDYYTDETRAIVREVYEDDLQIFGYDFEGKITI